jgi:two-component system response regulator AtoC
MDTQSLLEQHHPWKAKNMAGTDQYRIVVLDSDSERRNYLRSMISELGWVPFTFERETICLDNLSALSPDLIVFGPMFPRPGFRFINTVRMRNGNMPLVLISGDRLITDFVKTQEPDGVLLIESVLDPHEFKDLLREAIKDKASSGSKPVHPFVVGNSAAIVRIKKMILGINGSDDPVLLLGECGTGKDLIARVIYSRSKRSSNHFVKVDISGLSKHMSEARPKKRDAAPAIDVVDRPKGLFEAANTGTLFLDEVGALPTALQIELLCILEDRNYLFPVADVRIIASTSHLLDPLLESGRFRKDLYYRLNAFSVEIPPLRNRVDDIPLLMDYFADKFSMELGRSHFEISEKTKELFCAYRWPGNVRELENVVRDIVCTGSERGVADRLLSQEKNPYRSKQSVFILGGLANIRKYLQELDDLSLKTVCRSFMERTEKQIVQRALETSAWNRKKASTLLGISYRSLLSKMKEYELVTGNQD